MHKLTQLVIVFALIGISLSCSLFSKMFTSKDSYYYLIIQVRPDADSNSDVAMETVPKILSSRLNALGVNNDVEKYSSDDNQNNKLIVKIYGTVENPERVKKLLLTTSKLELRKVVSMPNPSPITTYKTEIEAQKSLTTEQEVMPMDAGKYNDEKRFVIVEKKTILTGADIRNAYPTANVNSSNNYQLAFTIKPEGAIKFKEWTSANLGSYLAIVLDKKVRSAPFIKGEIGDSGQIDGNFTKQEAEDLALTLKSGYLPASLELLEENFHSNK